jgi:ferritin-like protein
MKRIIFRVGVKRYGICVRVMPSEVFDVDKFVEISGHADSCAVKRLKGIVKLKVRTAGRLYTIKVEPAKAQEIINRLQCGVREI